MTAGEARAELVRDAAEMLHCSPDTAEFYVSAVAERHAGGMPTHYICEWLVLNLGPRSRAAHRDFVNVICRRLDEQQGSDAVPSPRQRTRYPHSSTVR